MRCSTEARVEGGRDALAGADSEAGPQGAGAVGGRKLPVEALLVPAVT